MVLPVAEVPDRSIRRPETNFDEPGMKPLLRMLPALDTKDPVSAIPGIFGLPRSSTDPAVTGRAPVSCGPPLRSGEPWSIYWPTLPSSRRDTLSSLNASSPPIPNVDSSARWSIKAASVCITLWPSIVSGRASSLLGAGPGPSAEDFRCGVVPSRFWAVARLGPCVYAVAYESLRPGPASFLLGAFLSSQGHIEGRCFCFGPVHRWVRTT
mmetsp:Transcript_16455/g.43090  ORF Transcript_16455/g.43090 Transcript_16455/m.43090 type:complete len:210 (-) Transcript_16455:80-709(-)